MTKRPPHAAHYRDRHGVLRWRFRKAGLPQSQTRALFGSAEWWEWYHAALAGEPRQIGASKTKPGSLSALVVDYYTSAEWQLLAEATRTTRRGIIERFRAKHGDLPVSRLTTENVRRLMDRMAATPAAANNLLKVLKVLMAFAVRREWRREDPTQGVKPLPYKSSGFHTWTEEQIEQFEARWPVGSRERLALDLLLYTGQRSADVRQMGRQHLRNGCIAVTQQKTRTELEIPLADALTASLAACHSGHLTFIVTEGGKPFTAGGFGNWFRGAAKKAGLPTGCCPHGLRKAAARRLAEAGCSAHEIMAITGHKTLAEVQRYTAKADQKRGAIAALQRAGQTKPEQPLSNLENRLANDGAK